MKKVALGIPYTDEKEIELISEVLRSGWLAHGPKVKQFQDEFAKFLGVKHAIAMNSCTSALHLALYTFPKKGEVILPSFTFVASANAIVTAGCKPVFCDIEYKTNNIDVNKIEELITEETVAIMPVHFGGLSCDMDAIKKIAEDHHLAIIEDSAETIGGLYKNKVAGSFGIGCFSFFPTKNLTTGEGGMLTTNDDELTSKIKALLAHGIFSNTFEREKQEKPWFRSASLPGYNFRMPDILAAVGVVQLSKLNEMNDLRRKHAKFLNENLDKTKFDLPFEPEGYKHVYQMYTIKLKNGNRDKFVLKLREQGVGASVHFDPPVHLQEYYLKNNFKKGDLSVTEKVANNIITLPMYPGMTDEDLNYIVEIVNNTKT